MNYDNTAVRLLNILNEGREIPNDVKCKAAWSKLLSTKDNSELYNRLGIIMGMPNTLMQEVKDLFPSQKKSITYIETRLSAAFDTQNLNGQWNSFVQHIDDHTIAYLEMLADMLETQSKNKLLNDEDVNRVLQNLKAVCDEIISAELDGELKKYLLRKIRSLISSIEEYQLTGINNILDAVDSSIGHAYTNKNYNEFLKNDDLGIKLSKVLSETANIITVFAGVPQLGQHIGLLLGID